jgi:uncharacterized iron-regulated membrane protein
MSHDTHNAHSKENKAVISFGNAFWLVIIIVGLFIAALNFIQVESASSGEGHGHEATHEATHGGHEAAAHEGHEAAAEHANEAAAPAAHEDATAPKAEEAAPKAGH